MFCAYDMANLISPSTKTMEDVSSAQSLKVLHFHCLIMIYYRIIANKCAIMILFVLLIQLGDRLYYMHMNTSEL